MSGRVLDASLGIAHMLSAEVAIDSSSDRRVQDWLALRMPNEMLRRDRIIQFPAPLDTCLLFDDEFEERCDVIDHPVVIAARARRQACERTAAVGYERGEQVISYCVFESPPFGGMVVDWLNALSEIDPQLLNKLSRVTWRQAIDRALAWHNRLAAKEREGIAGDEGTVDRLDVPGMPGWGWVHLVTQRALDNEGAAMGHCVGQGGYDHMLWEDGVRPAFALGGDDAGIWSLRDPAGKSRVTVEIGCMGIEQAQGPGNTRPEAQTVPAFQILIAKFEVPKDDCFDVPYWLFREKSGATRLRSYDEARADFGALNPARYVIAHGQVQFRAVGDAGALGDLGDVEHLQLDLPMTRRQRLGRGRTLMAEVVTRLEAEMVTRIVNATPLVEMLARVHERYVVEALLGAPAEQVEDVTVTYQAPAIGTRASRAAVHAARQPWYRQHERQLGGRRPR